MKTLTNKQFCALLRKAKKLAMRSYRDWYCIFHACNDVGIRFDENATFGNNNNGYRESFLYERDVVKSKANIAAVFNNSIRALSEEP